jgi:hypothetical protein
MNKQKKPSYGERIASGAMGGALGNYMNQNMGGKPAMNLKGTLGLGAALGAGSSAIGHGISDDEVVGGGVSGALLGAGMTGMTPGGSALVKLLMSNGMSKGKAIAAILGAGATLGGGLGAAGGGLEKLAYGDE